MHFITRRKCTKRTSAKNLYCMSMYWITYDKMSDAPPKISSIKKNRTATLFSSSFSSLLPLSALKLCVCVCSRVFATFGVEPHKLFKVFIQAKSLSLNQTHKQKQYTTEWKFINQDTNVHRIRPLSIFLTLRIIVVHHDNNNDYDDDDDDDVGNDGLKLHVCLCGFLHCFNQNVHNNCLFCICTRLLSKK